MNVKLLKDIQKRLLKQSQDAKHCRFNMNNFVAQTSHASNVLDKPACGTQACIAGETLIATGKAKYSRKYKAYVFPTAGTGGVGVRSQEHIQAQKALGLTDDQANRLFYFVGWQGNFGWPNDLSLAYRNAASSTERALIGAARIDRFIRTNGEQ